MGSRLGEGAAHCWSHSLQGARERCQCPVLRTQRLRPLTNSLFRPVITTCASGRQQQNHAQANSLVSSTGSGETEFFAGSWDSTSLDSLRGSFDTELEDNRPCSIGRILQGNSSVRGLLKHENQDRILALAKLHPACLGMELPTSSATANEVQSGKGSTQPQSMQQETSSSAPDLYLSAVFDGHGGSSSSSYAARRMQEMIQGEAALLAAFNETSGTCIFHEDVVSPGMLDAAGEGNSWAAHQSEIQQLWKKVFGNMDHEILDLSRASGKVDGTTALAGVHQGSSLVVANAGDCRAVLGRGGHALRLTCDHNPGVGAERRRIEAEGGVVRHLKGSWRVLLPNRDNTEIKICATSRGLGDLDFKTRRLISCEPEVTQVVLLPHVDSFSIFASDGLWGFVEDQDAVNTVTSILDQFSRMSKPDLQVAANAAAQALIKLALNKGSVDDMSVIVHVYDWMS